MPGKGHLTPLTRSAQSIIPRASESAVRNARSSAARNARGSAVRNARSISLWPSSSNSKAAESSPDTSNDTQAASSSSDPVLKDPWASEGTSASLPGSTVPPADASLSASSLPTATTPSSIPDGLSDVITSPVSPATSPLSSISPTGVPVDGNHIGDLAALGLGGNTPVGLAQTLLEQIHVNLGLPWWATILTVSIAARVILWPLITRGMARGARFLEIREDVEKLMKEAKENGAPEAQMRASLEARDLMKKHEANPFGSFPPMILQAAIVFTFFLALERMARFPLESMKEGGFAWIKDLTVADATWALPGIASLIFLGSVEITEIPKNDPNAARGKNLGRIFILVGFFILKSLPAGVVLYIGSNGVLQVLQSAFLRIPAVRSRLRLPPPKSFKPPPPPPSTS